ncbi:MAG: hypothetical protein U0791_10235 [Gemmataceae bacterium]
MFLRTITALFALALPASATDLNLPPINYEKATPDNAVSRLQAQLAANKAKLAFEDERGYLKSTLDALKIPVSSQVLVFSRTSLQRSKIAPKTPRAIYFNDDVYIGFCQRGEVLEVSVADPTLGTVFYSLDQEPAERPRFKRETESCLICHGSSSTRGIPGHLMRSVHPDRSGEPILGSGSYRTDDASAFEDRWGGWYVTGKSGKTEHLGNRVYRNRQDYDDPVNPIGTKNVLDLKPFFTPGVYLTPHSDIVALLVLGHQVNMHNRIARAALETRCAIHYQDELRKALKEPGAKYDSVRSRIASVGDDLLKVLLFTDYMPLDDRIEGNTTFTKDFAARGPFDSKGRSLRQFDLKERVFRFPCSYLIYSESFERLPDPVKDYVLRRLFDVLKGTDTDKSFAHLTPADRTAVLEILRETLPNLPAYWRE